MVKTSKQNFVRSKNPALDVTALRSALPFKRGIFQLSEKDFDFYEMLNKAIEENTYMIDYLPSLYVPCLGEYAETKKKWDMYIALPWYKRIFTRKPRRGVIITRPLI